MRRPQAAAGVAALLFALITQSSNSWCGNDAPQDQGKSSHLVSVRTYAPRDFRLSLLDRLSGGLAQHLPYRIAADSQGRILVTDPVLSVLHVFDTRQGKRWQMKGDRRHPLYGPAYIAVDADDNIYVTELGRSVVSVFQPSGRFMRTIGLGVLELPTGIWVDKQNRRLYVADYLRGEILSFDLEGKPLQVFGSFGTGPGQLQFPLDVALHRDTLVVLDAGNFRFELFDLQGNFRGLWPFGVNRTPIAFAFDAAGNLYYVDVDSGGLVGMDPQGKVLARFDPQRSFGQWIPQPSSPNFMCVATDGMGDILALRPTLKLEVVKLFTDAAG
jgi:DNA-binding beta-propeller fold protein YncE